MLIIYFAFRLTSECNVALVFMYAWWYRSVFDKLPPLRSNKLDLLTFCSVVSIDVLLE